MKHLATAALLVLCVGARPGYAQTKRAFTIEDAYRLKSVSGVTVSPDGRQVLYTLETFDLPRATRTSRTWMMDADGGNAREVTRGDRDTSPAFSPDGKWISFVRAADATPNLYLMPRDGGEPKALTSLSTGVSDPLWSPDGKWIAVSSDVYPECRDDACNKKVAATWSGGALKAHMADALLYRHWTSWKDGTATHTFLIDVTTGRSIDLTPGRFDFPGFSLGGPLQYAFSPDGREITIGSNHDKTPAASTNFDLWTIALNGGQPSEPRNITAANPGFDDNPKYSPDGRYIAYRTQRQAGYESDLFRLALFDRVLGASRILTESHRNWIDDFSWSRDSAAIYFSGPVEAHRPIFRLDIGSGGIRQVLDDKTIDGFELTNNDRSIIYARRSVADPIEIYRADLTGMSPAANVRPLSHVNDELAKEVDIRPAEAMWVDGAGGAKIQVFIVKPHGFDSTKKYPLILNVHGGPQGDWTDGFRNDWQVYPGAGYVVAFANPHGSVGYGQDFTAEISGDWGGQVFDDMMKVTDALEKLPYVDRDRMGAMGWSFGGYFMNWLEGHTTRFKAIASMMGLFDLRSFYGGTEELWFPEWDLKGQPWTSAFYEKWSPSNFVANFKTPCLVITGERDYRVPYTQGLQMFTALQRMNVPSRLIVYSNAGHWPSWYEMALYYTAHLEWFHQYLGGENAPWSTEAFLRNAVFDTTTGKQTDRTDH